LPIRSPILFELKYDGFRGIANTIDGLNLKSIVRLSARLLITGAILPLVRAGMIGKSVNKSSLASVFFALAAPAATMAAPIQPP